MRRSYRYPNRHGLGARTHASSAGTIMIPAQQQCTSDLPECNDRDWLVARVSCLWFSPSCLLPHAALPSIYHFLQIRCIRISPQIKSFHLIILKIQSPFHGRTNKKRRSERFFLVSSYIFTVFLLFLLNFTLFELEFRRLS